MSGDKSIRIAVNGKQEKLNLNAEGFFDYVTISPEWDYDFMGERKLTSLKVYNGEALIYDVSPDTRKISNLPLNKRLVLKAAYIDGTETKTAAFVFLTPMADGTLSEDGIIFFAGREVVDGYSFPRDEEGNIIEIPVKEIYFSDGLKRITQHAFTTLWELEKVVLPDSLEYIENYAFSECGFVFFFLKYSVFCDIINKKSELNYEKDIFLYTFIYYPCIMLYT